MNPLKEPKSYPNELGLPRSTSSNTEKMKQNKIDILRRRKVWQKFQKLPRYRGSQCMENRIQLLEQRLTKIEQEMLTLNRLKDELAKGNVEFDYS